MGLVIGYWPWSIGEHHHVEIKLRNPTEGASIYLTDIITYDEKPKGGLSLH